MSTGRGPRAEVRGPRTVEPKRERNEKRKTTDLPVGWRPARPTVDSTLKVVGRPTVDQSRSTVGRPARALGRPGPRTAGSGCFLAAGRSLSDGAGRERATPDQTFIGGDWWPPVLFFLLRLVVVAVVWLLPLLRVSSVVAFLFVPSFFFFGLTSSGTRRSVRWWQPVESSRDCGSDSRMMDSLTLCSWFLRRKDAEEPLFGSRSAYFSALLPCSESRWRRTVLGVLWRFVRWNDAGTSSSTIHSWSYCNSPGPTRPVTAFLFTEFHLGILENLKRNPPLLYEIPQSF